MDPAAGAPSGPGSPDGPLREINYSELFRLLQLPDDPATLEAWARPSGLSERRVRGVLGDQGSMAVPEAAPLSPWSWDHAPAGQFVSLEHSAWVVGIIESITIGFPGQTVGASGEHLRATVRLYDSKLADAVWRGILSGLLTGYCALVHVAPGGGAPVLLEVALTRQPLCCGARLVAAWEEIPLSRRHA